MSRRTRSSRRSTKRSTRSTKNSEKKNIINNIIRVFTVILGLTGLIVPLHLLRNELYKANTDYLKSFLLYILASPGCALSGLLFMKGFLNITEGIHDIPRVK